MYAIKILFIFLITILTFTPSSWAIYCSDTFKELNVTVVPRNKPINLGRILPIRSGDREEYIVRTDSAGNFLSATLERSNDLVQEVKIANLETSAIGEFTIVYRIISTRFIQTLDTKLNILPRPARVEEDISYGAYDRKNGNYFKITLGESNHLMKFEKYLSEPRIERPSSEGTVFGKLLYRWTEGTFEIPGTFREVDGYKFELFYNRVTKSKGFSIFKWKTGRLFRQEVSPNGVITRRWLQRPEPDLFWQN